MLGPVNNEPRGPLSPYPLQLVIALICKQVNVYIANIHSMIFRTR